jgi:hypothetical protein
MKLGKKYNSDIIYINMLSSGFVILNNLEKIKEWFVKKDILVDRPRDSLLGTFHPGHDGKYRQFSKSIGE